MKVTDKEASTVLAGNDHSKHGTNSARRFLPTIVFVICFVALGIGRATGMNESVANLILLSAATVVTLHVFGQRFPMQNVVGLAVTITVFAGLLLLITSALRVSFALPLLNKNFSNLPAWTFPLLWIVALVNARGIAKALLHPWRKIRNYGLWLIAFSSLVVAGLNLRAEFSGQLILMQFLFAAVAYVTTVPWFIDKRNVERPPDFQPFVIATLVFCW